MQRPLIRCTVLAVLVALSVGCGGPPADEVAAPAAPAVSPPEDALGANFIEGLGDYHFPITTDVPEVQRWFDQALMLTFGFNHDAAERSYLRATELDPECAMCWWGASLVVGPHVNAMMDPADNADAWNRLQKAIEFAPMASEREQAFIKALSARYAANPPEDRRPLDEAYAAATRELMQSRPDDLDAASFHAEALMDLQPWDFWDEQYQPKGNTPEIIEVLESVIDRNPDHAGALHLYVHAVEASAEPERGAAAADRLRELIPGSGHLVHMPAHIYARVGRWHDAVIANQKAILADDAYLAMCRGNAQGLYPLGYVPHNHHFLWFAASMEGASEVARKAAVDTSARTHLPELMRQPGFAGLQHYWLTDWFDHVRFGRWDAIAGRANPAPDLPYPTAIWNYAQGFAAVAQGRADDARKHHDALRQLVEGGEIEPLMMWDRYSLGLATRIAELSLRAEVAMRLDDDSAGAIAALEQAVAIEDSIPYDEPPGWHQPVRHVLGALLLELDRPVEAEAVYRRELERNPANGWSLQGLAQSLRAQGRGDDAARVEAEFTAAWSHADVQLAASRF